MKRIPITFINQQQAVGDADDMSDARESTELLERLARDAQRALSLLPPGADPLKRAGLLLQLARTLLRLEKMQEAWDHAREAFDAYAQAESWEGAVQCCDVMFLADRPESLAALGNGLWLGVTYPINPELTVALLKHVVDETPPESDGAAVAAITAHYIADLRAQAPARDDLLLYTTQLLTTVARRHSNVDGQGEFDAWIKRLELDDPARFLPRLRNVIDVLVQDEWWVDRDALRAKLPT